VTSIYHKVFPNRITGVLGIVYIVALLWWIEIFLTGARDTQQNYLFGVLIGVLPLFGGIGGLILSSKWGTLSSAIGRSIFFLSLGLITWSLGTLIFAYYNLVLLVEVPYPSLADAAYIISWPLWVVGVINLSKGTGAKFGLRSSRGKVLLFAAPLIAIVVSYYLLVVVARGGVFDFTESGVVKIFFDLAYPIGDVVILTVATLIYGLSFRYFGGQFKIPIYIILAGFILNYLSDFSFSYTTTLETFYVASWVDLLFLSTMFFLALGVNSLDAKMLSMGDKIS